MRVLSCAPPMYDELWTGGKAMYKLEPALAEEGELIIYAPHLDVVSHGMANTFMKLATMCCRTFCISGTSSSIFHWALLRIVRT